MLALAALLTAASVSSWQVLEASQRRARTLDALHQARLCLLRRIVQSGSYPTWTPGLVCAADAPGDQGATIETAGRDVDACLCEANVRDGWGSRLYYLEGASEGSGLQGKAVLDWQLRGTQERGRPSSRSAVLDAHGQRRDNVAFVLLSFGQDKVPDKDSYGAFFAGVNGHRARAARMDGTSTPDFSHASGGTDAIEADIALVVSAYELAARLRE